MSTTLKDIQKKVAKIEKERGFNKNKISKEALLLEEEMGELFKELRKN